MKIHANTYIHTYTPICIHTCILNNLYKRHPICMQISIYTIKPKYRYMCLQTHACTCTDICTHTLQTHRYTTACTNTYVYMCTQIHTYTCTPTQTHEYTSTHLYMHIDTHTNIYINMYTTIRVHMYTCTLTNTYTSKYMCTHMYNSIHISL